MTDLNKNKILNQKSCRDSCTLVYTDRKSIAGISNIQERKRVYSRTTKILFVMSTAFLILNGPIALCKIIGFVYLKIETDPDKNSTTIEVTPNEYFFSTKNFSKQDIPNSNFFLIFESNNTRFTEQNKKSINHFSVFEKMSNILYYLNFVLNFFLYSFTGSKFREALFLLFHKFYPFSFIKLAQNNRVTRRNRYIVSQNQVILTQKKTLTFKSSDNIKIPIISQNCKNLEN